MTKSAAKARLQMAASAVNEAQEMDGLSSEQYSKLEDIRHSLLEYIEEIGA